MSTRRGQPDAKATTPRHRRGAKPLRFLLVDDHTVVRHGLRDILAKGLPDVTFGEAQSAQQMLEQVWQHTWDGIIMDVTMPGRNGLDALSDVKRACPKTPVLVLSMHGEDHYAVRALRAGAAGYLTKDKAPEELVVAVTRILSGRRYISAALAEQLADEAAGGNERLPHHKLTQREFQILCLLASARTMKEIADELSLSTKTVSTHHVRILDKMGMTRDAELVRYALDHRLIE